MFVYKLFAFLLIVLIISEIETRQSGHRNKSSKKIVQDALIFKLDRKCFKGIFNYLALKDLVNVGKTCQNMNSISGLYFLDTFDTSVEFKEGKFSKNSLSLSSFSPFVRKIKAFGDFDISRKNKYYELQEIEFYNTFITTTDYEFNFFKGVETFIFTGSTKFIGDIHEALFKHCNNFKHLCVRHNDIDNSKFWIRKHYRTLKNFEFITDGFHDSMIGRTDNVLFFLRRNSHIKKFTTTVDCLDKIIKGITSAIQLDVLSIIHSKSLLSNIEFKSFVNNLWELKGRMFQNLHLYYRLNGKNYLYRPEVLKCVTVLHITYENHNFTLSPMEKLEKLFIKSTSQINDIDTINNMENINYIYIQKDNIDNIVPIIRDLPKLRKLQIKYIEHGKYFNSRFNILEVAQIYQQYRNGTSYVKLTIYVDEMIYLATKFALKLHKFKLIEIKRFESYRSPQEYEPNK